MRLFHLTPQAEASLETIGKYTEERWGYTQSEKYLDALDARFHDLAITPLKGRLREDIAPGLRSFPEGKHVIFYLLRPDGILFTDILHDNMEPVLHLPH